MARRSLRCLQECRWGDYLHFARGCAGRYGRDDFGCADDSELSRHAVERDARRTSEIGAENLNGRSHAAGRGQSFDERSKPKRKLEDCAIIVGSPLIRCSVELAIGGLYQPS